MAIVMNKKVLATSKFFIVDQYINCLWNFFKAQANSTSTVGDQAIQPPKKAGKFPATKIAPISMRDSQKTPPQHGVQFC